MLTCSDMVFTLSNEIKSEVTELANLYSDEFSTDIEKVAESLGLDVWQAKFQHPDTAGVIQKDEGDKFTIFVDENAPPNRQRYTLAHEIGHYISWKHGSFSKKILDQKQYVERKRVSDSRDEVEVEANAIAAELLMPEERIKNYIQSVSGNTTPEKMATLFNVSEAAMGFRLQNLGYVVS